MTQNIFRKIVLCFLIITPVFIFAQDTTRTTVANNSNGIDLNTILTVVAFFLLFPIYITGKSFGLLITEYVRQEKIKSETIKKGTLLLALLGSTGAIQAQSASGFNIDYTSLSGTLLLAVILIEALLILFFTWMINKLVRVLANKEIASSTEAVRPKKSLSVWLRKIWDRLNSFKPLEEEASIDTGHSYDGIRELDNITPPWFITAFGLTIIFAIVYLYRYHVSKSAPLQAEEFAIEMAKAESEKAEMLSKQSNNVDEKSITMLGTTDIKAGQVLFSTKCTPCHGAQGGSMPGGVGPNLTDDYWIHGGAIANVFKSIKYGWVEKGMISWKDQLSPIQMAQLASYVKSIRGTNPPGAKDPQGDLEKEEVETKADSVISDSSKKKEIQKISKIN